jgi:hypothetical protein
LTRIVPPFKLKHKTLDAKNSLQINYLHQLMVSKTAPLVLPIAGLPSDAAERSSWHAPDRNRVDHGVGSLPCSVRSDSWQRFGVRSVLGGVVNWPRSPEVLLQAKLKELVLLDGLRCDALLPLKPRSELKVQLASDLHLEHIESSFRGERLIRPAFGADVLVLAGDIAEGTRAIELFGDWPVPVLYVAGNHEFYSGRRWEQKRSDLRRAAQGTSVVFLDCDAADLMPFEAWRARRMSMAEGVRFLGCTLWTDYRYRCNRTQRQLMENAELRISDHRRITTEHGSFLRRRCTQGS